MKDEDIINSHCEKDDQGTHCWATIGVIGIRPIYEVLKCVECGKAITIELDMLVKAKGMKK